LIAVTLLLAERVLMMEAGTIAHELIVDLPRPRDVSPCASRS
jgi:ABC-type nitrate/sulfonate/bicarbonate transport system ATPase subunit